MTCRCKRCKLQVSQWQLMYDACGQPAWAKPWGDYL